MEGAALGRRQQPSEGIGWGSWDRLGRFVILVWFWMIGGGEGDELELGRMETTAYARTAEGDQTKQTETRLQLVFFIVNYLHGTPSAVEQSNASILSLPLLLQRS